MMNLQRLSTVPTPVLRSVVFATGIVGLLAVGSEGHQTTGESPRTDLSAASFSTTQEFATALPPSSMSDDDLSQTHLQTRLKLATTDPSLTGDVGDAMMALHMPKAVVEAAEAHVLSAEPAPVQVASADPSDMEIGDANRAVNSIDVVDECLVMGICVDRYLWALYQRTPKEDTIKVPVRRHVSVKRKGKMVTVARTFTKLVDQDFGWKDPKAAERVRLSMMDYVIGGMDRSFKLKLFYMLHAAEAAGLSPGITSGFRDDYRQSIASGLKAASNRSYHGGSLRGGYGHGLAADVVSVEGGTRDQRWASSAKLWKWIDAHGKEFGIGRPYLGKDPPHVAPIDGQEYAKHNRGTEQAASDVKKVHIKKAEVKKVDVRKMKRVATRDHSRPAKRSRTAAVSTALKRAE
ncbi:peptidase M15 [Afipia sp. Root123D2]|uniref:peptidase M15 n=1 Tax=Afipia sp. Root123D2 TaxID=1736436 RepID=UPI000700491D|nr:peptidase M15 [Afipia sp. Root123D2]KQW20922.1 peptidase M15 [Afipia sp. Root123D2]